MDGSYGPGREYTIDTRRPFEVRTSLHSSSGMTAGASFASMVTELRQGEKTLEIRNEAGSAYLDAMAGAMRKGMAMRITYWGNKSSTMSWLDSPPCGHQACTHDTAGPALIGNM